MSYTPLSKLLDTKKSNWQIKVRVLRIWDSVNVKTKELLGLDLIVADKDAMLYHCCIWKHLVKDFRSLLLEGSVYEIKNLKITKTNRYRPVAGDYKIVFLSTTTVTKKVGDDDGIPHHRFEFADYNLIVQRADDYEILTDVIGLLIGYGPIEYIGAPSAGRRKRELEILLAGCHVLRVTLWGAKKKQVGANGSSRVSNK